LQVIGKWSGTSVKQDLLTGGGIVEGLRDAGLDTLQGLGPFLADPMQGVNGLRELINNPEARAKMGDEVYAELITKINRIDNALATGGDGNAIQLGRDLGDLIFQAGVIATGVNGLAKGGAMLARAGINVSTSTLKNMVVSGTRIGLGDSSVASGIKGALLNSENAVIDAQKITNYALNPAHPVGGNKAIVFESALGYNQTNADSLIAQLQKGVSQYPASIGKADQFGQRFTVDIPVQGPNGSTAVVRTGWIYDPGSSTPRLTTLYVK
jgi:filamentous hemagglutinin